MCERSARIGAAGWSKARGGFTLFEVLLALGLIGLLAGVLVTLSVHLTDEQAATPEQVFWKAVGEARKQALLTGLDVRLRFVAKNKTYALVASGAAGEQRFPIESVPELALDFLSTQKATSAVTIRGQLVETQTIPYVTFYGDGTCTPFRVQIRTEGPAQTIAIDPWTCAPVLAANTQRR
jgi:prepilin-type N-terminal cleavage/methylation domain-containing protein